MVAASKLKGVGIFRRPKFKTNCSALPMGEKKNLRIFHGSQMSLVQFASNFEHLKHV